MKLSKVLVFLAFAAALPFHLAAQFETVNENAETEGSKVAFYLLPLIEAAFSGNLAWRPDWPANIPPDAFSPANGEARPLSITLSNDTTRLNFTRDSEGRLTEFPFFLPNGYLQVEAVFSASGALRRMNITCETVWNVEFPDNFLPFSEISLGGAFPRITINRDGTTFFVFIFESPIFLTESWYDAQGELIGFNKAWVARENPSENRNFWRIRAMEIRDAQGIHKEQFFYDSTGNISEIRSRAGVFSALYRGGRPVFWQLRDGSSHALQWDGHGLLVRKRNTLEELEPGQPYEFRYMYETDAQGNWTRRSTAEIIDTFGLFAPRPYYEEHNWNRVIRFF